jgi:uncharacterized protein (TIGR02598 family)
MKTNFPSTPISKGFLTRNAAFSLVEVVLAVGIMAIGVVTILGLLPHGMEMSRKTANEQAETRIVDQLVGEVQSSDWETMGGIASQSEGITRFFDDQGLVITGAAGSISEILNYVARVSLADPTEKKSGMILPSRDGKSTNKNLRRVIVEVAATQDQNFNFDSPPAAIPVKRVTQLVAKMRAQAKK